MIFITVGSQKFQFNRLLKKIDDLVREGEITEKVFAQVGYSDYKPNFECIDFLTQEEMTKKINEASVIITHGGTGTIINALKQNKKVIAVPRLAKYSEHVDDHQIQLLKQFEAMNFIEMVYDIENLKDTLKTIKSKRYNKYISNTEKIIENIKSFILSEKE